MNAAAIVTWLFCGLPQIVAIARGEVAAGVGATWLACNVLYGAALLAVLYSHRLPALRTAHHLALVGVQALAGFAIIVLSAVFMGGTGATTALLVIVAAELPYLVTLRPAIAWVVAQTAAIIVLLEQLTGGFDWAEVAALGIAIGGFQLFATASSFLVRREAEAREKFAAANAELHATRALLAEASRGDERLRISRDLHDALGHHLTALSLQLDVAARLSAGKAADHIHQAHALTRLLLADVRSVVSSLRDTGGLDVSHAIRALAAAAPADLAMHLDLPPALLIDDGDRAEAIVRCVQEIITNTARHAEARNLWVRVESRPDGLALHAHDDGRGAAAVVLGHGLTGMRERFAEHAGSIEFAARPAAGFEVRGFLPAARTSP